MTVSVVFTCEIVILVHRTTVGKIISQVFFAILIGAFSLGQAVPNLEKFVTAVGASSVVYSIIDKV